MVDAPSPQGVPSPSADLHVHTEWSWDAPRGDMSASCQEAIDAGLTAVAFTEHADFGELANDSRAVVDLGEYLAAVATCRDRFPALTIQTGIELGQPHMHAAEVAALLNGGNPPLDRVLGSMHLAMVDGRLVDVSFGAGAVEPACWPDVVRSSLGLTLELVASDAPFEILAHLEYAKRFWPHAVMPYVDSDYEEQYRAVLETAARRDLVLEINTTRGGPIRQALGPGLEVLRWWHAAGGQAVCFGSDAHDPSRVGRGLDAAADLAGAAGFHPTTADDLHWGRRAQR